MFRFLLLFSTVVLLSNCQKDAASQWQSTDLLSYGIPVSVMTPDSAQIKASDMAGGLIKDVTIQAGPDYSIQIITSTAETSDIAKIKADQLANVKGNRYFSQIIEEKENGFVYETAVDSTYRSYGFRYIVVQGEQEIIFQSGLAGTFSLEAIQAMYTAVQQ